MGAIEDALCMHREKIAESFDVSVDASIAWRVALGRVHMKQTRLDM